MRSLIKLAIVLLICFVAIGFYRGWFSFSRSSPDAQGDKVNVNMSVDKDKMKSDVKKAKEMVKEEVGKIAGKGKPKEAK